MKLQRNSIAFHSWYSTTTAEIKELSRQQCTTGDTEHAGPSSQSTQSFFEDADIHRYFDEVAVIAKLMKESVNKAPEFQAAATPFTKQGPIMYEKAVLAGDGYEVVYQRKGSGQERADLDINSVLRELEDEDVVNDEEKLENDREKADVVNGSGENTAVTIYVPVSDKDNHPFLLHSSTPMSCMVVAPENLGCSLDCGVPDADRRVSSDIMIRNKRLFSSVFSLRKDVMDYLFQNIESVSKV